MIAILRESLQVFWPEAILSLGGLLVVLIGAWSSNVAYESEGAPRRRLSHAGAWIMRVQPAFLATWIVLFSSAVSLWVLTRTAKFPPEGQTFFGLIICDGFSLAFRWLVLGVISLVVLMVQSCRCVDERLKGECLALLLFVAVGMMLMATAAHLLMAYVAIELVSLSSYVLTGLAHDRRSAEASLKYLLFGALSSGIMLFGMSLLFGLTGFLEFSRILDAVSSIDGARLTALVVAVVLILAGLAFKISMVPFHMWTPDVYEGAPTPIAALLSVGPKAAGLALLIRFTEALSPAWSLVVPLAVSLTVVTMTLGNLVALVQTNIKRLLAYSTIGQVGYLLIGFVVGTHNGLQAVIIYLVAYLFMNLGAFACVVAVENDTGSNAIEAFHGLSRRSPALALCCAVFLLSLAGIPPLLGFFGKFYLFGAAIDADLPWLAVFGVVNSAIALYYYVNIIRIMYLEGPQRAAQLHPAITVRLALGICAAVTLLLGCFPGPLLGAIQKVASVSLL